MSTVAAQLRKRDATLAGEKLASDLATAQRLLEQLLTAKQVMKHEKGAMTIFWSPSFPADLFSLVEPRGSAADYLVQWAQEQEFAKVTPVSEHSCNWREDCDEAGCSFNLGVVFHY